MKRRLYMLKAALAAFAVVLQAYAPLAAEAAQNVGVKVVAVISNEEALGKLVQPSGLFFDEGKKRLYIADSGGKRIVSTNQEYRFLAEFTNPAMSLPVQIVKAASGLFYVVDASKGALLAVDTKLDIVKPVEIKPAQPGRDVFVPGRIAIGKDEKLYVIDKLNKRILVSDAQGAVSRAIVVKDEAGLYGFNDVRVDADNNVYALDAVGARVYVFDASGAEIASFGGRTDKTTLMRFPVSLAVSRTGLIYVADRHAGAVLVYDRTGQLQYAISQKGEREGELSSPTYIMIDEAQRIYVIDNNRIQVFKEAKL